jgi:hypothetical protein
MALVWAASMSLSRGHQVIAIEVEDDLAGADYADDIGIHIGYRVAGYLEGEELPSRMPVILAELLEVVHYLAVTL